VPRWAWCVSRLSCVLRVSARGQANTSPLRAAPAHLGLRQPASGCAVSRGRRTQRVPRGALSRCIRRLGRRTTRRSSDDARRREVGKPRPKASPALGRTLPPARGRRRR
jgi:hypothetical protein